MKATLVLLATISLNLHALPAESNPMTALNGNSGQNLGEATETANIQNVSLPQVRVWIDKTSQTISVSAPETADMKDGLLVRYVSTGGGMKHPVDPKTGLPDTPYCADDVTPLVNAAVIPAIEGQTMFRDKRSNRFTSSKGEGVAMPNAISVPGHPGIFLHQVPGGKMADGTRYSDHLGNNVSGGCIRLDAEMSRWLYDEMLAYGSIELTIMGENPPGPSKCGKGKSKVLPPLQTGDLF